MKTINLKSAFVTASAIALLTLTSNVASAQWKSDRDYKDKTLREKIEDKLEGERRSKEDNRWDRRDDDRWDRRDDDRWDRRDVKYNNGRFNKHNRYDRNDCCRNCNHDNKFNKHNRKKNRKNR